MPNKLPIISAKEAIKAFEKIDYQIMRQRGSHVRWRRGMIISAAEIEIPRA